MRLGNGKGETYTILETVCAGKVCYFIAPLFYDLTFFFSISCQRHTGLCDVVLWYKGSPFGFLGDSHGCKRNMSYYNGGLLQETCSFFNENLCRINDWSVWPNEEQDALKYICNEIFNMQLAINSLSQNVSLINMRAAWFYSTVSKFGRSSSNSVTRHS